MAPAEHTQLHEGPFDIVMSEIGQQRWNRYKKTIRPVENEYMGKVDQLASPTKMNEAAGLAMSGVMKEASPMIQQQESQMQQAGINPNSGAYKMNRVNMGNNLADALGGAEINARQGQKNRYLQGLENIVAIGNNQAGTAQQSLSDVADMSRQRAMGEIQFNAAENQAMGNAVGTGAGLAIGAYGRKYGG